MLVSFCCGKVVVVAHSEDCSYYVCSKCKLPTDPKTWVDKRRAAKGKNDADIQPEVDG